MGDDTATVIASVSGVAKRVMDERPIGDGAADEVVLAVGAAEDGAAGEAGAGESAPSDSAPGDSAPSDGVVAEPGREARPSLSPSRAGDFLTCPLLYRFRVIDRLPEPPSPAAARGTLVHAVLERLFDAPAAGRTSEAARALLEPEWARLVGAEPELAGLFDGGLDRATWLAEAGTMLDRYFTLEDPRRIEPAHRELCVEADLASGLRLRGYIDRLDVAPSGDTRIVDYKTGGAPPEEFEARALFQMKFYALTLWRAQGRVPKLLQLMYLGNGEIVRYEPDESDLLATERKIEALWRAIERAKRDRDWRPRRGRICDWCAHQAICPAFGGTPPPLPDAPPPAGEPLPAPDSPPAPPAAGAPAQGIPAGDQAPGIPAGDQAPGIPAAGNPDLAAVDQDRTRPDPPGSCEGPPSITEAP